MTTKTDLKRYFSHLDNEGKEQAFIYAMLFDKESICKQADEFSKMFTLADNYNSQKVVMLSKPLIRGGGDIVRKPKNWKVNPQMRNDVRKGFITEVKDVRK